MGPGDQAGVMVATSKYKGVLANVILVIGVWWLNVLLQVLLNHPLMVVMTQIAQMMSQPTCSVMSLHSLEKSMDMLKLTWDWVPNLFYARWVSAAQILQDQAMLASTFVESLNVLNLLRTTPEHVKNPNGKVMITAMMKITPQDVSTMGEIAARNLQMMVGIPTAMIVNA